MGILTLLKANIKYKKGAFISVVILMLIITTALTAVLSVSDNQQNDLQKAMERANIGDVGVFIHEQFVTDELVKAVEDDSDTAQVDVVKGAAVNNCFTVAGTKSSSMVFIASVNQAEHSYSVFTEDLTGFEEKTEALKPGEIYLPLGIKELHHCEIGDKVTISLPSQNLTFKVKGFVEEPYVGAYFIGIKQVFAADEDLQLLYDLMENEENTGEDRLSPYRLIHVYQNESSSLTSAEYKSKLAGETGILDYGIALSKSDSVNYTTVFGRVFSGILYAFIILLFIIVLIVIGHSVSTGIEAEYVNLGILKSQGYTKGKIRSIFVLQYLSAEVAGVVLGIIAAIPVTKMLGRIFLIINGIRTTTSIAVEKSLAALLVILAAGCLFIFIKTRKIGKVSPIRAIAGGRDTIYFDSRIQVPVTSRGLNIKMALRQFSSNKRQYLGTIMIIAILVYFMISMTLLSGLTSSEGIGELFGGFYADVEISYKDGFQSERINEIEQAVEKITLIVKAQYKASDYWLLDNQEFHASIYEDPETITGLLSGRLPIYENEIVITEILSDEIGRGMGDTVTLSYKGKSAEFIISGFYQSTSDVGRCFALSLEGAKRLCEIPLEYGELLLENPEKADLVTQLLNEEYGDVLKAETIENSTGSITMIEYGLKSITILIYIISVIFTIVVVQMVSSRLFFKEKQDLGIMKAVGFTTGTLRLQFAIRFLIIAGAGAVIGFSLNALFNDKMFSVLFRIVGISHFQTVYSVFKVGAPTVVICGGCFMSAYLASRKIKQVEIRELIVE